MDHLVRRLGVVGTSGQLYGVRQGMGEGEKGGKRGQSGREGVVCCGAQLNPERGFGSCYVDTPCGFCVRSRWDTYAYRLYARDDGVVAVLVASGDEQYAMFQVLNSIVLRCIPICRTVGNRRKCFTSFSSILFYYSQ